MSAGRDNAIRTGAIALTAGLALVAVAAGFVLLPQLEGKSRLSGGLGRDLQRGRHRPAGAAGAPPWPPRARRARSC